MPARIGKYEVLDTIGRGGFATVYKARDPLMKRLVAIKLCTEQDEDLRRRFLREAQIAGSLDHPSIVRGFDCGFDEAGVYLVEEYLDGEDLAHKIRSRLPLPYRARLAILIEVAQAIAYAHSKGVFHRDLKPGNIRILESGRAKLMDFGIAKMSSGSGPLTKAGTLLGTAGYVAPEQVLGKAVDHRVDIFAFGALTYEFFTYRRPFTGQTVRERLRSVLDVNPEPIAAFWADCPPGLERAVFRCLEKDPAQRYQSFADVIADLEQVHGEMMDAEEASTATLLQEPQPAAADAASDATLYVPDAPDAAPDATPALDATLVAPVVPAIPPRPPRLPAPVPAAGAGAQPQVGDTVVGGPVEPRRPSAAPGRRWLDGAGNLARSAAAILAGVPRVWLAAAVAAVVAVGAGILVWSLFSRQRGAEPEPPADVPAVAAAVAPAPAADEPAATPGRLVVSAAPWGELAEVKGGDGEVVVTPPGSTTPLVLTLPPGEYEVRVERPGQDGEPRSCRATVLAAEIAHCSIELGRVTGLDYFKESGWWQ
jgi:eukaryotic-like serine/threonine-protein kinase